MLTRFCTVFTLIASALLGLSGASLAQFPGGLKYVSDTASFSPAVLHPGGKGTISVALKVAPGFHINAAKPNDPDLIATTVTAAAPEGFALGRIIYPAARTITAPSLSQKPLLVYTGANTVSLPISLQKNVAPGSYAVPVVVEYQGCNATACFPPKIDHFRVMITVK